MIFFWPSSSAYQMSAIKKIRFWTWTCHLSIIIETNLFCLAAKCMQLFFLHVVGGRFNTAYHFANFLLKISKNSIALVSPNLQVILLVKILLFLQHQNSSRLYLTKNLNLNFKKIIIIFNSLQTQISSSIV